MDNQLKIHNAAINRIRQFMAHAANRANDYRYPNGDPMQNDARHFIAWMAQLSRMVADQAQRLRKIGAMLEETKRDLPAVHQEIASETRRRIMVSLFRKVGTCVVCGKVHCPHKNADRDLPQMIDADTVLAAIRGDDSNIH